jgi:hypothetical protein
MPIQRGDLKVPIHILRVLVPVKGNPEFNNARDAFIAAYAKLAPMLPVHSIILRESQDNPRHNVILQMGDVQRGYLDMKTVDRRLLIVAWNPNMLKPYEVVVTSANSESFSEVDWDTLYDTLEGMK